MLSALPPSCSHHADASTPFSTSQARLKYINTALQQVPGCGDISAARLPRNYGLAHDQSKVVAHPASTPYGELVVRGASCAGPVLASFPLPDPKAMGDVQSQQTGNPCSVSQAASIAALEGDQGCVETMRREFEDRRDLVCDRLARLAGVRSFRPEGAFYAFFDVSAHFGRALAGRQVNDSAGFCNAALELAHVNLVPGSGFVIPAVRISASDPKSLPYLLKSESRRFRRRLVGHV